MMHGIGDECVGPWNRLGSAIVFRSTSEYLSGILVDGGAHGVDGVSWAHPGSLSESLEGGR